MVRLFLITLLACCTEVIASVRQHHNPSPIVIGIRSALERKQRPKSRRHAVNTINSSSESPIVIGIQSALARKKRPTSSRRDAVDAVSGTSAYTHRTRSAFLKTQSSAPHPDYRDEASLLLGNADLQHQPQPLTTPMNVRHNYRALSFVETMICGAVSRSVAQTIMHPFNCMKTLLQQPGSSSLIQLMRPTNWGLLTRGAGAQAILSIPNGAVNFAVIEFVRGQLSTSPLWGPGLDFLSSCIATITCSAVSTPQMMLCDNIMAGNYPNIVAAAKGLARKGDLYAGWWPGLAGKLPSYALTWTLFQQLKRLHQTAILAKQKNRVAKDWENSVMGCLASATAVCVMIPMDTVKTRLVTQAGRSSEKVYKGIIDCAIKTFQQEGIGAFYRGLPPRLISVVPMIGIQFGVYEAMKKIMHQRQANSASIELMEEFE